MARAWSSACARTSIRPPGSTRCARLGVGLAGYAGHRFRVRPSARDRARADAHRQRPARRHRVDALPDRHPERSGPGPDRSGRGTGGRAHRPHRRPLPGVARFHGRHRVGDRSPEGPPRPPQPEDAAAGRRGPRPPAMCASGSRLRERRRIGTSEQTCAGRCSSCSRKASTTPSATRTAPRSRSSCAWSALGWC